MTNGLASQWNVSRHPVGDPLVLSFARGMSELEGLELPPGSLRRPMKEIVIEGCLGDAALRRYWSAIKPHIENQSIKVWAADLLDPAQLNPAGASDDSERKRRQRMVDGLNEMQGAGIVYLNKQNAKDLRIYENLSVDAVIIATWDETHC